MYRNRLNHPISITNPLPALALVALTVVSGAFASPGSARAEICPPDDSAACFVRCRLHKRDCAAACRAEKRECVLRVRASLQECKLGCRNDPTAAADVGTCKRDCVATAIELARSECGLGKDTCVRQCNPESCRELCGTEPEPSVSVAPTNPSTIRDGVGSVDECVPPVDRDCLGGCADDLRACAQRVGQAGRACLDECATLRGPERWQCVRTCAESIQTNGAVCRRNFGLCVDDCRAADTEAAPTPE
jgi:hypothetical protein